MQHRNVAGCVVNKVMMFGCQPRSADKHRHTRGARGVKVGGKGLWGRKVDDHIARASKIMRIRSERQVAVCFPIEAANGHVRFARGVRNGTTHSSAGAKNS